MQRRRCMARCTGTRVGEFALTVYSKVARTELPGDNRQLPSTLSERGGRGGVEMMIRGLVVIVGIVAALIAAPSATAYPPDTCSDTARTNIPAGDPDYGDWLDRDGDGIACESEWAGYTPVRPLLGGPRTYVTFVTWLGAPWCIPVRFPNGPTITEQLLCDSDNVVPTAHGNWITHTATPGQLIGVDPAMGGAELLQCVIEDDETDVELYRSSAHAGDGTDVNCLIPAP